MMRAGGPRYGYGCTVDGCDWVLPGNAADTIPTSYTVRGDLPPQEAIDQAIRAVAIARGRRLDELLAEHAESHDERDFLHTVHRLHLELARRVTDGPGRAYAQRVQALRAELGDSPDAVAWIRVIHRLRMELAQHDSGIRPHADGNRPNRASAAATGTGMQACATETGTATPTTESERP